MTNKEQLAYLAGLIDGEGCICSVYQRAKDIYTLQLEVASTNSLVLKWVRLLFGGNLYQYPKKSKRKSVWHLRWRAVEAIILLKAILPYLKIKQREAKEAITYERTFNNNSLVKKWRKIPKWAKKIRYEIYENLRKLKEIE